MTMTSSRGHKSSEIFTYTNPGPFPEWQVHKAMPPDLCFFAESLRIEPVRFGKILWIMVYCFDGNDNRRPLLYGHVSSWYWVVLGTFAVQYGHRRVLA